MRRLLALVLGVAMVLGTVTMEQLLGGSHLGPITLKLMRDVCGSNITLSGIVSHPDYLSTAARLTVILK